MKETSKIQIQCAIGLVVVESSATGIVGIEIIPSGTDEAIFSTANVDSDVQTKSHLMRAKTALLDYFRDGTPIPAIPLDLIGTEFQKSVWNQISRVAFGQTTSYSEIARLIGNPKAVRAVGGAVGANPVPLLIGCHRILGSGGRLTGYSGGSGLTTKRELLAHESIDFKQ